jgi:hypothetical protein
MPLSAAGSALVAGSSQEKDMQAQQNQPKTSSVRVLRAFYFNGKPVKVNETLDLPRLFALEMRAAHKVEIIEAKPETKPEPVKAEPRTRGLV